MHFTTPAPGVQILLIAVVLVAAVYDMRFRRIPNWLSVTGVVLGLALNTFLYGLTGLKDSAISLLVGFGIYFVLYALRAMGAGDAKLMAAVGAIVGSWQNWMGIFMVTAILGGAAAVVFSLARGRLQKTLWNVRFILGEILRGRAPYVKHEELDVRNPNALRMPHGAIICVATIVFLALTYKFTR